MNWHSLSVEEIFKKLDINEIGLSSVEAKKRLEKFGPNEIPEKKNKSLFLIFLKQFHSVLIYILLAAAAISFFLDHLIDTYVILAVVFLNAVIGFVQEFRAEKAIEALKKMIVAQAKVFRDGELMQLPIRDLVLGDIVFLEEGDKIPADARLLEVKNFRTVESSLTGESSPINKNIKILSEKTSLADCQNMVWLGTFVAGGQAKAVVVATGAQTAIGQVVESLKAIKKTKGHFEKRSDVLAKQMGVIAIVGALITFLVGFFIRGFEFFEIFLFTIASLVSGIPEGLPAILVVVLAVGAYRMAKRKAIIRNLPATETLGVATAIATDKTGTLTQNTMNVEKIILFGEEEINVSGLGWRPEGNFFQGKKKIYPLEKTSLLKLLRIAALCNNSRLIKEKKDQNKYSIIGDPTEASLLVLAEKAGWRQGKILETEKRIDDLPFNPELKYRASLAALVEEAGDKEIYVIGAPENILEKSYQLIYQGSLEAMTDNHKKEITNQIKGLAVNGMRVLGLAYKKIKSETKNLTEDLVNQLIFVGVVGIKDPPRPNVKEAILRARGAGIRVIMKTGDHQDTALAIAQEIGLIEENDQEKKEKLVLTEQDLLKMSETEFEEAVKEVSVFARLTPNMKLKIVGVLQKQGHIVAMTGDGVNDAPALKKADIGISMGVVGTDVARESSSIVLADDNFASIINAVEEGRTVFTNTRQASSFLVTTNFAENLTIIVTLLFGFPLPLLPTQILWLNLVTDTFAGIGLAFEPTKKNILEEPPRKSNENILSQEIIPFVLIMVVTMAILTFFIFKFYLKIDLDLARTGAFAIMAFTQIFNLFNMRSSKKSVFSIGFFKNKIVNIGFFISFFLTILVLYLPLLQSVFRFISLPLDHLLIIIALSSLVFWLGEAYKNFQAKKWLKLKF